MRRYTGARHQRYTAGQHAAILYRCMRPDVNIKLLSQRLLPPFTINDLEDMHDWHVQFDAWRRFFNQSLSKVLNRIFCWGHGSWGVCWSGWGKWNRLINQFRINVFSFVVACSCCPTLSIVSFFRDDFSAVLLQILGYMGLWVLSYSAQACTTSENMCRLRHQSFCNYSRKQACTIDVQ